MSKKSLLERIKEFSDVMPQQSQGENLQKRQNYHICQIENAYSNNFQEDYLMGMLSSIKSPQYKAKVLRTAREELRIREEEGEFYR